MTDLAMRDYAGHRPRFLRVTPVVAAVALAAAMITGCTSSDEGTDSAAPPASAPLPEAAQIVQESARTTQTLQAVHLDLEVSGLPDLPVETVSADVTNQPQGAGQAMGTARVRTAPEEPFIDAEFIVVDKTLYTAAGDAAYAPVGPAEKIYDPGVILDKDKGLANVIAQVQNPKTEGRETLDGTNVVKISGTIDSAVIDPIVPRSGEGGGSYPITLWIADVAPPETAQAAKPSEEPSPGDGPNLVRAVVDKAPGSIQVTLSKWAEPVEVVKPQG
ncbi:LppX_LprAFG lipoprotein [Nocardia sp. NPDC003345]